MERSSLALLACGVAVPKGVPRLPDPGGRPLVGGVIVALAAVAALVGSWEERVRRVALANGVVGLATCALAALAG